MKSAIRNICKEERVSLGVTQEEFAKLLNVTRRTIIRWEKDPETIPVKSFADILILSARGAA